MSDTGIKLASLVSPALTEGFFTTSATSGFSSGSVDKDSACSAGDQGLIPRLGRSPGGGNDNPLQYSCLGNPVDRGAWQATVHWVVRVGHDLVTKPTYLEYGDDGEFDLILRVVDFH